MAKRKAEEYPLVEGQDGNGSSSKRIATETSSILASFREGLFDQKTSASYASSYATSGPYKHGVIHELMDDALLRSVRTEIINNIHFTPKETDIYKIHQSGDLANLSGLESSALAKLPSLLKLRDALYSENFRQWLDEVTGSGPLSGRKTDMAVNVYAPGCHLICHDDVIGSRRVSYILYLTDPHNPWKAEWGGALRLYPTDEQQDVNGRTVKLPRPDWSKVIPPAWNQLSFFSVQPGESFHDVEEVYKRADGEGADDGGRIRMAISGWFHIPQEGESGYEPGIEDSLAEKSSLQQLQGKAEQFDEPQVQWFDPALPYTVHNGHPDKGKSARVGAADGNELTETDLEFLLIYMTPNYLTPDTVEELGEMFMDESTLQLSNFLSKAFSTKLRQHLDKGLFTSQELKTSRPPHKHRYQYLQPSIAPTTSTAQGNEPVDDLLDRFLPSLAFRKWLSLATGLTLKRCSVIARRFRRGLDYQLAQGYEFENPQLEFCLCITPTSGWGDDVDEVTNATSGNSLEDDPDVNVGGYEVYMAGDDLDEDGSDIEDHAGTGTSVATQSHTGAGNRRSARAKKADPAIYNAATDDEGDGILFSNPANWNTLSLALRDRGTMKFVKYVSRSAKGDRFDFAGAVEVEPEGDDDEEEEFDGFDD